MESKIQPDTAYQKQQETLIVWSEGENYDLALSFQEKAGCDEIWEKICQVNYLIFLIRDRPWFTFACFLFLPIFDQLSTPTSKECVRAGAAGSRTRRSLGHHLLHPLILRLVVLYVPAVLRPRALQDAPAPADPNS